MKKTAKGKDESLAAVKRRGRKSRKPSNEELLKNAESMTIKELADMYGAGLSSVKRWLHDARGGKRPTRKQKAKPTQSTGDQANEPQHANISELLAPKDNESASDFIRRTTGEVFVKDCRVSEAITVDDLIRRRQAILDYVLPAVKTLTGQDALIKLDYVVHKKNDYGIVDASIYCRYNITTAEDLEGDDERRAMYDKYGDLYGSSFKRIRVYADDEYMILLDIMHELKRF